MHIINDFSKAADHLNKAHYDALVAFLDNLSTLDPKVHHSSALLILT